MNRAIRKKKNGCVRLLWLASVLLLCLPAAIRPEQLPVKHYSIADGLGHDEVQHIMQDSRGFLWFCTSDGLSRFDGYRFTTYGLKDGLPVVSINFLLESRDGTYWVATNGGGVSRFNPQRAGGDTKEPPKLFTSYRLGTSELSNFVNVIYEDAAGRIWAGTDAGLYRLLKREDGGVAFEHVPLGPLPAKVPQREPEVKGLVEDGEGALCIATYYGLLRKLPDGRLIHYAVRTSAATDSIWAILLDKEKRLWLGHQSGLMVFYPQLAASTPTDEVSLEQMAAGQKEAAALSDGRVVLPAAPGEAVWFTTEDGLSHNNIQALHQSADGRLWVGTRGGGVSVFDGQRFASYAATQGISNRVNSLAEDGAGNFWVGTQASGAIKVARGGLVSYREAEGLGHPEIIRIFETRAGELCAISAKWTINRFDGARFTAVRPNLPGHIIDASSGRWVIFEDHQGEWWVATGHGVYRFPRVSRLEDLARARPVAVYTTREGLADDNISRMFEDSRGDIWIGTYNPPVMLTRWERATDTFHQYTSEHGHPDGNWANVFAEDKAGHVWIGLHNGGLARVRHNRLELFGKAEGVPEGLTQGAYLDSGGRLWFATSNGGAARIDDPAAERPRITVYDITKNLATNNLRAFTEDAWGNIYIGTARGIDRLELSTGRIKHFSTADGLIKSEVTAAFRDRQGTLWFGTREGLSRLAPEAEKAQAPPPVLIGGLRAGGIARPISELGESEVGGLEFSPDENQIQIDFFGLSFSAGGGLRYQYRFEGVDADWSAPTDQRTVAASLAPGRYRFLVRAVDANGATSPVPATISFTILPPIWQRWWFLMLSAIVIGAIVYLIERYRVARAIELERVRTRIATDLHDDIGASLSQIAIMSEVVTQRVDRADARVNEPLQMIAGTSREMVDAMSDIVWAINPKRDHLSDLTQRMRRFASDILSAREIDFRFRVPPEEEKNIRLGADLRREVYLIFKESVNNLVKYSKCTDAELEFKIEDDYLIIRVSDNGVGFDVEQASNGHHSGMGGHGLASMRKRAEALGGSFEVESVQGQGTTVLLQVPVAGRRSTFINWKRALPK